MAESTTTTVHEHRSPWHKVLIAALIFVGLILFLPYLAMFLGVFGLTVPIFLIALVVILALGKIFESVQRA